MATWPSASKASTANLDSGTDSPASARADIKTNVDNVNSIIDMFNITSPTNNQILQYSSANARFEVATPSSGANSKVIFNFSNLTAIGGSNTDQRATPVIILDSANIATISSTYNITLPAGTYLFSVEPLAGGGNTNQGSIGYTLYNVSGTTTRDRIIGGYGNNVGYIFTLGDRSYKTLTFASAVTFYIGMPSSGNAYVFYGTSLPPPITFEKIA
jgi:hypothetical protein